VLIPPPPVRPLPDGDSSLSQDSLLLPFLCLNSKITYEHDGQYHKGYLTKHDVCYCFSFKSHVNKRKEDWGVNLPNLVMTWVDFCVEGILVPGHVSHTFLWSPSSSAPTTFDPVASFVSAVNLHLACPPSLLKALADSHPDREVWLSSFLEEKRGIQHLNTYRKITLGKYRALCEKGAPKAIPTMCVLTVKRDENLNPLRAKSWIVVLGNHEDRVWSKSDRFASVLCSDTLRFLVSIAVGKRHPLRQGDCKNAFCQGILPPFLPKRSPSIDLPQVIPKLHLMNIRFFSGPWMVFGVAHVTGMTRSIKFSFLLVSPPPLKIRVSSQASYVIPTTLTVMFPTNHSLWASTLMTSSTSPKIPPLRNCFVAFSASIAK
jgi:hypothetical protein